MTATQGDRISRRVINSDLVFCSKAKAFLYVVLHRRNPDGQRIQVTTSSVKGIAGVDSYKDRPSALATFSVEILFASDRSLSVHSHRSES
jgi:hypothetical protein